jgi:hypothetical protein
MGIIGKVYANSMLVLNNSRMLLGSDEEEPEIVLSEAVFGAPPIGDKDNVTEVHHGALSVDSDEMTRHSRGPEV